MALNFTTAFTVLKSLNYTANCEVATQWRQSYALYPFGNSSSVGNTSLSLNSDFVDMAWPTMYQTINDSEKDLFYNTISDDDTSAWIQTAFDDIDTKCLAPQLAQKVRFIDLELTRNCSSTTAYYDNTLGAINSQKQYAVSGWFQNHFGHHLWISNLSLQLDTPAGLVMIRNSWPSSVSNISDAALSAWSRIAFSNFTAIGNGSTMVEVCQKCIDELCTEAEFSGNPDLAGIGVLISYVMAAALATIRPVLKLAAHVRALSKPLADDTRAWQSTIYASEKSQELLKNSLWFFAISLALAGVISYRLDYLHTWYEELISSSISFLSFSALAAVAIFSFDDFENWTEIIFLMIALWLMFVRVGTSFQLILPESRRTNYGDWACLTSKLGVSITILGLVGPVVYSVVVCSFLVPFFFILITALLADIRRKTIWCLDKLFPRRKHMPDFHFGRRRTGSSGVANLLKKARESETRLRLKNAIQSRARLIIVLILLVVTWIEIIFVVLLRNAMIEISGAAWTETSWGFGQLVGLLIWAPVMVNFGEEFVNKWQALA